MPTYPLPTLAATVIPQGITSPSYADIYQSLQASAQAIYGTDVYIDPDSQDGQLLAIVAKAISDGNDADVGVFNSFSPATAQGAALSSNVRINGIARAVPSNSQVVQRVVGQVGTTITNGVVTDVDQKHRWNLPPSVTIPPAGFIDITATAVDSGDIAAVTGTLTGIVNPQLGWQSTTNTADASRGAPVESDAALRRRQTISTAQPALTVIESTLGAVAAVTGVTQVQVYENDTDTTDANGQPEHSIAVVAIGGAAADIAQAIFLRKTPGAFTYGSTTVVVNDPKTGLPNNIRYSVATPVPLSVAITIKALTGYTTAVGTAIKQSIADYVNALGIGKRSDIGKLYLPAQFFGVYPAGLFEVNVLQQAIKPATPTAADVTIAFNAIAALDVADIALTVT